MIVTNVTSETLYCIKSNYYTVYYFRFIYRTIGAYVSKDTETFRNIIIINLLMMREKIPNKFH